MARTHIHYEKWGDNTVNIQGRITVFVFCHSRHCLLSYTKFDLNANSNFSYLPEKVPDGRTKRRLYTSPFGKHKNTTHSVHDILNTVFTNYI